MILNIRRNGFHASAWRLTIAGCVVIFLALVWFPSFAHDIFICKGSPVAHSVGCDWMIVPPEFIWQTGWAIILFPLLLLVVCLTLIANTWRQQLFIAFMIEFALIWIVALGYFLYISTPYPISGYFVATLALTILGNALLLWGMVAVIHGSIAQRKQV
jgi:hypothetical protein